MSSGISMAIRLTSVCQIWQHAPHNAFTDLIAFNHTLWCVFREGSAHISADGAFRILRSVDGKHWYPTALLRSPIADLRDAKLSQLPDGRLVLFGAGALHNKSQQSHQSYVWFSDDGLHWSDAVAVGEPNIWIWRLSWLKQQGYAVGYKCGQPHLVRLYHTLDGLHFSAVKPDIYSGSYANESGLLFEPDGTALCLLRRDPENGLFGQSQPPYTHWQWLDIGCSIGGPQWLSLPDGRLLACVRLYNGKVRTSLCLIDRYSGQLTEHLTLPSGGDCSYAGMVLRGQQLYISYYSSHEGKTAIYMAIASL